LVYGARLQLKIVKTVPLRADLARVGSETVGLHSWQHAQVEMGRVEMYQLFKDFDRSKAYTRIVTPTQFCRILTTLKVCVNPEDMRLLCRKFADARTGDINYPAFVQCVDKLFTNYTVERLKEYDCPPACPKVLAARLMLFNLLLRVSYQTIISRRIVRGL